MKDFFSPTKTNLLVYQYLAHAALIYLLFTGTWKEWLICLALYYFKVTIGGTVLLHRYLSHKSFVAPKWFEYFASFLAATGGNSTTIGWVAIHREHHRHTDTELDPHSPKYIGYWKVQFRSMTRLPKLKYVPDLLRSKFHVHLHNYHWAYSLGFAAVLCLIDPRAVMYAYLVPSLLVWHGGSSINSLNHSPIGYRNYETKDDSVNNLVTGILVAGEGWHNNHHAQPSNPQFGHKWWEFDLGWQIIKLIRLDKPKNDIPV